MLSMNAIETTENTNEIKPTKTCDVRYRGSTVAGMKCTKEKGHKSLKHSFKDPIDYYNQVSIEWFEEFTDESC